MYAIEVSNVSKRFRREARSFVTSLKYTFKPSYIQVLDNIGFRVEKGEIFGLLGPNGAGKTTLIKIILGLLEADRGEVKIFDHKIPEEMEKIKQKINAVFARGGVYWTLTLRENLEWFGKIYRVKNLDRKINGLIDIFELESKANVYADRCSTGELMRVKLARAMLNNPEILFLDEPTIGLDPNIALKVREFIQKLNKERKTTILLTTHYMAEADRLCKRVAIMNKGKIITIDTPKNLKKKLKKQNIVEIDVKNMRQEILDRIERLDGVVGLGYTQETEELRIILEDLGVLDGIINIFKRSKLKFYSIHTEEPTLEDVFMYLTGRRLE